MNVIRRSNEWTWEMEVRSEIWNSMCLFLMETESIPTGFPIEYQLISSASNVTSASIVIAPIIVSQQM